MNNVVTLKLSKPASNQRKLKELCAWIDANIEKPIGWVELIEQSGMDHIKLQSEFTTYLKTSPMQWIRFRRNELVQTLIAQAQLNQQQLPTSLMQ